MEMCVFARHAESTYNVAGLVNGDPSLPVGLSSRGFLQARSLAGKLGPLGVEACVHSPFERTLETARIALAAVVPPPPFICEPLLGDIGGGVMEGGPVFDDHSWRCSRGRDQSPRGGESLAEAALRIARGLRTLGARTEARVAVVTHELILRYALNAAAGSADIAGPWREIPHATPFTFEPEALVRAAGRIEAFALGAWGSAVPDADANGG
jgi:broad specificity phosphatase PhoE